jgi:hypothetical protein
LGANFLYPAILPALFFRKKSGCSAGILSISMMFGNTKPGNFFFNLAKKNCQQKKRRFILRFFVIKNQNFVVDFEGTF